MNNYNIPSSNQYKTPLHINYSNPNIFNSPQNSALRYKNFATTANENLRVISSNNNNNTWMLNSPNEHLRIISSNNNYGQIIMNHQNDNLRGNLSNNNYNQIKSNTNINYMTTTQNLTLLSPKNNLIQASPKQDFRVFSSNINYNQIMSNIKNEGSSPNFNYNQININENISVFSPKNDYNYNVNKSNKENLSNNNYNQMTSTNENLRDISQKNDFKNAMKISIKGENLMGISLNSNNNQTTEVEISKEHLKENFKVLSFNNNYNNIMTNSNENLGKITLNKPFNQNMTANDRQTCVESTLNYISNSMNSVLTQKKPDKISCTSPASKLKSDKEDKRKSSLKEIETQTNFQVIQYPASNENLENVKMSFTSGKENNCLMIKNDLIEKSFKKSAPQININENISVGEQKVTIDTLRKILNNQKIPDDEQNNLSSTDRTFFRREKKNNANIEKLLNSIDERITVTDNILKMSPHNISNNETTEKIIEHNVNEQFSSLKNEENNNDDLEKQIITHINDENFSLNKKTENEILEKKTFNHTEDNSCRKYSHIKNQKSISVCEKNYVCLNRMKEANEKSGIQININRGTDYTKLFRNIKIKSCHVINEKTEEGDINKKKEENLLLKILKLKKKDALQEVEELEKEILCLEKEKKIEIIQEKLNQKNNENLKKGYYACQTRTNMKKNQTKNKTSKIKKANDKENCVPECCIDSLEKEIFETLKIFCETTKVMERNKKKEVIKC